MKKLALMMFALLILGCGTEKPAVNEPEPVVEEQAPIVIEDEPIPQPEMIAEGTVKHGEVNVNPKLLNLSGFRFEFKEPFYSHSVSLYDKKRGKQLSRWDSPHAHWWIETKVVVIEHWDSHDPPRGLLEYDTDYEITIYTQNFDCDVSETVIQFRTEPRRSTVEGPEPVMQERLPAVPPGEHFRLDITPPELVWADVDDGAADIDPEPLNVNGIRFVFDRDIRKYQIDLRDRAGASLGWLPRGLVERENIGNEIKIMRAEGAPLLEFDTVYVIDIFVQDCCCWTNDFLITFRTKPNP